MHQFTMAQKIATSLARHRQLQSKLTPKGLFTTELIRAGQVIHREEFPNGITNAGRNLVLDVMFGATAKSANWYMGLINNSPAPTLAAADTMASHAGWVEFTTYSEATRPAWTTGAAASQAITNPAVVEFTISTGGVVYGAFIVNQNTKSGTTGTLWSTAPHAAPITVVAADVIRNTYTVLD